MKPIAVKIDLHCHTTVSDGRLTPTEIIHRAVDKKVDVLAITDHDHVAAFFEAKSLIQAENLPIQLIPGIELSVNWQGKEIHMLGLNFDPDNARIHELVKQQGERRNERAQRISDKLTRIGLVDGLARIKAKNPTGIITRNHFAKLLIEDGLCSSMQNAFTRFLGKGKIGFVKTEWADLKTCIDIISAAGGKAAIAHPTRYKQNNRKLREMIAEFAQLGGHGIEIGWSQQSPSDREFLGRLALEHQLEVTAGSDFHSPAPWLELGKNLTLSERYTPVWHDWALNTAI